ncbi:MAG: hypothetical protein ACQCN4_04560 [Candidatus Bathyarchaeia archaeon]
MKFMVEHESVSSSLIESAVRVLLQVAFRFEPLAPTAITLYLNQQLHRYKEGGIVGDYKAHTKRLGKYHYRIELDLNLTGRQALHLLANIFPKQTNGYRRWFHE